MDKEKVLIDYDGLLRDIARKVKVNLLHTRRHITRIKNGGNFMCG